jgi:hypothetical protein
LAEVSTATALTVYLPALSRVVMVKPPLVLRGRSVFIRLTDLQRLRERTIRQRLTR